MCLLTALINDMHDCPDPCCQMHTGTCNRRFESLSQLMCEANNWAVYRDHLRKLLEEGIVRERETKDPLNLLASYQLLSLGCSNGCESNAELRTLITKATHNTEAQNYKISYQLETA